MQDIIETYKQLILPYRIRTEKAEARVHMMEEALMNMAKELAKERLRNEGMHNM